MFVVDSTFLVCLRVLAKVTHIFSSFFLNFILGKQSTISCKCKDKLIHDFFPTKILFMNNSHYVVLKAKLLGGEAYSA